MRGPKTKWARVSRRSKPKRAAIIARFALVSPAAAMGFASVANDDPNLTLATAVVFAVYGAALAAYVVRPLLR